MTPHPILFRTRPLKRKQMVVIKPYLTGSWHSIGNSVDLNMTKQGTIITTRAN